MADPNFQGIDPQQLGQLMQSLKNGVNNAQPLANSYMGQFTRLGLDTTAVTKLQQNYSWAQSQQTMLQRRQTLATHQPSGQWHNGMATAGAGVLQYATAAQAQAAGTKAAQQYKDGKITAAQYFKLLEANSHDPDWQTGAAKTLGSTGVQQLEQAAQDQYPANTAGLKALAAAVAAGMAAGATYPYSTDPMDKGTENLQLLAPLLGYASFPASALVTLGNEVTSGGPNTDAVTADPVLQALAANPQAAAEFMAQFKNTHGYDLGKYISQGSDHYGMMPPEEASLFANVITAGTVGAKTIAPKLATQNVTSLVSYYKDNSGSHTYAPIQAAYGGIIKSYWPDVMYSITSPASGTMSPDGFNLTSSDWAPFVQEAMRDPHTGAMLLVSAHTQGSRWQTAASQQPGGPNAGDSYAFSAGLVNGYFDYQAKQDYVTLSKEGADANAWQDSLSTQVGTVLETGIDVVADPGSAAKTVVVAGAKDITGFVKDSLFNSVKSDPTSLQTPNYQTWQGAYSSQAFQDYNNANPKTLAGNPLLQNMVDSAKNYDGGSFTKNGQIMNESAMNSAQRQAYNAWLQSPAVVEYLRNSGASTVYDDGYNLATNVTDFQAASASAQ